MIIDTNLFSTKNIFKKILKTMKNLILLIIFLLLSTQVSATLTLAQLQEIKGKKNSHKQQISKVEERIIDFVQSVENHASAKKNYLWLTNSRVDRWDNAKLKKQESILEQEGYVWEEGSVMPKEWPSKIHRFSKIIDTRLLDIGYFSIYKNDNYPQDKNNISAVVPCVVYMTTKQGYDLEFPCMLEYGFDKNNVCFHRCVRGLGWKGFEKSFDSVKHLARTNNGKLSWNLDKFNSYEIFDNDVPTDKMKVLILKSHETVNTKSSDI